ncbi:sigma-E factor negative regulatory protein [Beggiatoa alba]|nr:sigma-E factor negative regulatory protein [Beggiatoa alba]
MTNSSDERISALMDGELDKRAHHDAVDELLKNDESRDTWFRYHLISDTLRQHLPAGMDAQFSSRVMKALQDEPTVLAPRPPRRAFQGTALGRRLAGLAVAASVAAVAVLGVQFMYQQDDRSLAGQMAQTPTTLSPTLSPILSSNRPSVSQSIARAVVRPNIQIVTQAANPVVATPPLAKRYHPNLNKYLVDHNQQAPRAALQGVVPYARIVAYPNSRYIIIQAQK